MFVMGTKNDTPISGTYLLFRVLKIVPENTQSHACFGC